MSARPLPPDYAAKFEAVEEGPDWRVQSSGLCRYRLDGPAHIYCRQPAVAALNRGRGGRQNWWVYCAEHLYGRWVEDSKVMRWQAVFPKPRAAPMAPVSLDDQEGE